MVYDTGDPREPQDPAWFQMTCHKERFKDDLDDRVNKPRPNRCYSAEHVLEWQLFADFIEADIEKEEDSRCVFLYKFFDDTPLPEQNYKIQAAVQAPKPPATQKYAPVLKQNGHFDYEQVEYDFAKWQSPKGTKPDPRAIDYIGKHVPGDFFGQGGSK